MDDSLSLPPELEGAPPSTAPAPGSPATPSVLPVCADLRGTTPAQVFAELSRLHAELVSRGLFASADLELHEDGTTAIKSQVAVWLLGATAAAIGKKRLVNLRKIDKKKLFSVGGVASLVCTALAISASGSAA